ncbi:uncharacterized protein LOC144864500 [Branchiostoma floridae x Branchiostoma japonicum]
MVVNRWVLFSLCTRIPGQRRDESAWRKTRRRLYKNPQYERGMLGTISSTMTSCDNNNNCSAVQWLESKKVTQLLKMQHKMADLPSRPVSSLKLMKSCFSRDIFFPRISVIPLR